MAEALTLLAPRRCGASDLRLSPLGLGCWPFGGGDYWGALDQSDANVVVRRALELGINTFDTAEVYNEGRSEVALGLALRGLPRDQVVVCTKVSPAAVYPDLLPGRCEASLRRLGSDYIDLYMVHWPITARSIAHFTREPIAGPAVEDAFAALLKLREQGKIRHIGVSNFAPNKLEEALATGAAIAANQLPYNLLCRAIELEALPFCKARGIGVIGYMALLQGVLSDRYPSLDDVPGPQRRTRHFDVRKSAEARHGECGAETETTAALAAIRALAAELGMTTSQLALKWALANPSIQCMLVSSRSVRKLEDNVAAASSPLATDVIERLNALTLPLLEKLGPSFDYYESAANDRTR